jgi:hypothetical protein
MFKLSLEIFIIISLFEPSIQQYNYTYCAKYIATNPLTLKSCMYNNDIHNESSMLYKIIENLPNNNCSNPGLSKFTYSSDICKNNMIISPIIPSVPSKNVNWNEYIVLSGSNFASNYKKNIVKSAEIQKKVLLIEENSFSKFVVSEFLISFSAFLFTITFFISHRHNNFFNCVFII